MSQLAPCRAAAAAVLTPEGARELRAHLQRQPVPSPASKRPATNEPEVPALGGESHLGTLGERVALGPTGRAPGSSLSMALELYPAHVGPRRSAVLPLSCLCPQEEESAEHALSEEDIAAAADAWAQGTAALPEPWQPQHPV